MIVHISPDWRIISDSYCFKCQKWRKDKWDSKTFHATFEDAAEYMLELKLRDDPIELSSLKAALDHIRDARRQFRADFMDHPDSPSEKHSMSDLRMVG